MGPGEKRQDEVIYKQKLVHESGIFPCCTVFCSSFTLFKTLAISFSATTLFTRFTPLCGSSLLYADPTKPSLVMGFCTFPHQVIEELVIVMMLRLVELTTKSTSCAQTFRNGNRVDRNIKRPLPSHYIFPCYPVFS
ncbi:hypothetical protein SADUNF_Sadunf05G0042600 [Salix dunnii]|uniref:Uncharacterized protein n=1 Tax=Salix dunnii TaxID=1413687 RepID=A0A835K6R1_9ROSI|nr:hypothetical protein SADUNF_Sadunf05G0042600 [Salix dunnii]